MLYRGNELYKHYGWDHKQIHEYSSKKFREFVKFAYNNSKFYKSYYDECGIRYEDLDTISICDIPTINKDMVYKNFYDIATKYIDPKDVAKALESNELIAKVGEYSLVHTSGSTGKPCNFLYDKRAIKIIESNMMRISLGGCNKVGWGDLPIKTIYIASVGSGYASSAIAMGGIDEYHSKSIILNAKDPIDTWRSKANSFNPSYMAGYVSCIKIVADLQKAGEINLRPKKIIIGGEPLSRETSKYFKEVFGADVTNYYGCTESILLGVGTSWYEGMYLLDDMNYFEIDKENRLIITPLYNKIFPLIRYQLNDVVEGFTKEPVPPLPFTHINRIIGREEEIMWFKNREGKMDFLHPLLLDDLDVEEIKEYQFIQKSDSYFILKCVKMNNESLDVEHKIREQIDIMLKGKKLDNIKYDVVFTDKLDIDKLSGKEKMVIKEGI